MAHFFVRLTPKRPDFPADMTQAEGAAMAGHVAFLTEQLKKGILVVSGPVMAPGGVFGAGVFEGESVDAIQQLLASDPGNAVGTYEVYAMGDAIGRPRA